MRLAIVLLALVAAAPLAVAAPAAFSSAAAGTPPSPWRVVTLPRLERHTHYEIVRHEGESVLRVEAERSYAALLHPLPGEAAGLLHWRWRVERPIEGSDLQQRSGDDAPARLCVLFDVPLDRLDLADRLRVELGRLIFNPDLPAAAICYVWDRLLDRGTWLANATTSRAQMLVLRRGDYGRWFDESRDLAADFARAFPREARGGTPPLAAIAISADGDDTGGHSLAYFGDLRLEPRAATGAQPRSAQRGPVQ